MRQAFGPRELAWRVIAPGHKWLWLHREKPWKCVGDTGGCVVDRGDRAGDKDTVVGAQVAALRAGGAVLGTGVSVCCRQGRLWWGKEGMGGRERHKKDWGENVVSEYTGCRSPKTFKQRHRNRERGRGGKDRLVTLLSVLSSSQSIGYGLLFPTRPPSRSSPEALRMYLFIACGG